MRDSRQPTGRRGATDSGRPRNDGNSRPGQRVQLAGRDDDELAIADQIANRLEQGVASSAAAEYSSPFLAAVATRGTCRFASR